MFPLASFHRRPMKNRVSNHLLDHGFPRVFLGFSLDLSVSVSLCSHDSLLSQCSPLCLPHFLALPSPHDCLLLRDSDGKGKRKSKRKKREKRREKEGRRRSSFNYTERCEFLLKEKLLLNRMRRRGQQGVSHERCVVQGK
jgi:hypothetical protein